jgi:hypothetical protein
LSPGAGAQETPSPVPVTETPSSSEEHLGDNLCREVDLIVLGRVETSDAEWAETELGRIIMTTFDIRVERVLSGDLHSGRLALPLPGGKLDGVGLSISGTPRLEVGTWYLLYLRRPRDGEGFIVSLWVPLPPLSGRTLKRLPDEARLREAWRDLCAARGGEIYEDSEIEVRVPRSIDPLARRLVWPLDHAHK